jgi:hypothetical protein
MNKYFLSYNCDNGGDQYTTNLYGVIGPDKETVYLELVEALEQGRNYQQDLNAVYQKWMDSVTITSISVEETDRRFVAYTELKKSKSPEYGFAFQGGVVEFPDDDHFYESDILTMDQYFNLHKPS